MKIWRLVIAAGVLLGLAAPVYAQSRVNIIFQSKTGAAAQDRALARAGATKIQKLDAFHAVTANVPGKAARQLLERDASVVLVEDDYKVRATTINDAAKVEGASDVGATDDTLPTGVDRIDAEAGSAPNTGAGVVVAIVDTGIDLEHPDLAANIVGQYNAIRPRKSANDDNGHGTHVAGIVAAIDNGDGVIGVAPEAGLLAVKVLDRKGSGYSSDVAEGIDWAVNNGADVINMSLGSDSASVLIQEAVQQAEAAGVLVVCAAGNDGHAGTGASTVDYPAAFTQCIAVSAWTDLDGTSAATGQISPWGDPDESLASFSSTGPEVEVTAPGVEIYSAWKDGGYSTKSGTSMSSPHAAGVLALLIADGSTDPRADLSATAEAVDGTPDEVGNGLIRAGEPNDAPVVSITSPADAAEFDSGAVVDFAGNDSDTEDGDLTAGLLWTSSIDGQIGAGAGFSAALSDGEHTITAEAADSKGKTGRASVSILVGEPPAEPTVVSVASVTYAAEGGRNGDRHLSITVALVDDFGGPVAGASVSIDLYLNSSLYAIGSGPTGADGRVTFSLKNAPYGTYASVVTSVAAAGLTWDGLTPENSFTK